MPRVDYLNCPTQRQIRIAILISERNFQPRRGIFRVAADTEDVAGTEGPRPVS
jgi:hypothetical protein